MDKGIPLTQVSSLFMKIHFHPLLDMDKEEDSWRIDATLPLIVFWAPLALVR